MKKIWVIVSFLFFCSLVVGQSSEVSVNFNMGGVADVAKDYVPSPSFWDVYGVYIIGLVIILIIVIIFNKRNKRVVKKVRRKVVKKKSSRK